MTELIDIQFLTPEEIGIDFLNGFIKGRDGVDAVYSDQPPNPPGPASAGTAEEASRADHVHAPPPLDDAIAMALIFG